MTRNEFKEKGFDSLKKGDKVYYFDYETGNVYLGKITFVYKIGLPFVEFMPKGLDKPLKVYDNRFLITDLKDADKFGLILKNIKEYNEVRLNNLLKENTQDYQKKMDLLNKDLKSLKEINKNVM